MVGLKKLMGMMPQAAKAGVQKVAPKATGATNPHGGLNGFVNQLKSGAIKANPNQPALPHTASGRLNLIG